jgi:hypothetical protein
MGVLRHKHKWRETRREIVGKYLYIFYTCDGDGLCPESGYKMVIKDAPR